jgi:fibronectin type 3 domain-containing protein
MKKQLLTLFTIIFIILTASIGIAGSVTLAWDANVESDLDNYKIYRGTSSGNYSAPVINLKTDTAGRNPACGTPYDPFKAQCCEYTVTGLEEGETYYFAATALDVEKNESAYSDELTHTVEVTVETTDKPSTVLEPTKFEKIPMIP